MKKDKRLRPLAPISMLEPLQWLSMVVVLEEIHCMIAKAFCIPSYLLREPRPPSELL